LTSPDYCNFNLYSDCPTSVNWGHKGFEVGISVIPP